MILWVFLALVVAFVVLPVIGAAIGWVIWTAIAGIVLGGLARLIIPGRQNIGLFATIACGWIGSLGGGAIASALWGFHHHHHWFATVLIEIGIAAVAVGTWSVATRKNPRRHVDSGSSSMYHRIIDI
jgi:uncharacterized membrane protein YeaQ/YmgE (transglycosylase-associated protein family)